MFRSRARVDATLRLEGLAARARMARQGKGGKGRDRRTRRQGSQRDDADPVAGIDGIVSAHVQCYGCQKFGHVKKKGDAVNCPWWVVKTDGSEYYDANLKAAAGAANPSAPRAVVDQVVPAPTTPAIDLDALMEAFTLADGPDDDTVAAMKQVYLTASTRNARAKPVIWASCLLASLGCWAGPRPARASRRSLEPTAHSVLLWKSSTTTQALPSR
jgi:hypothetical protein